MASKLQRNAIPLVAVVIGALLALQGITAVIRDLLVIQQMNLRQSPEFVIQQSSSSQWWLSFLLGLLSVLLGIALLRGVSWARLGAMAILALIIADKLVIFFWPALHEPAGQRLPLWFAGNLFITLLNLTPFLLMLLFLATPGVRDAWQDTHGSRDLLDRWGGALEKRLPTALPGVVAFIALYLICLGLSSVSPIIMNLTIFRQITDWRDDVLMVVRFTGGLIVYLGFILAGVALLRRARWAKQLTLAALGVATLGICAVYIYSVITVAFTGQPATPTGNFASSLAIIVNGGTLLMKVVTYAILATFLLRALPKLSAAEERGAAT